MDTIKILDLYRVSLNSDKISMQILNFLLRYGPQQEKDIKAFLNISLKEVKNKVRKLYQASLIRKDEKQNLFLTELAKYYLLRSGFVELAAKSLTKERKRPDWETAFLQACIEAKSSTNDLQANKYLNLLRSLDILRSEGKKELFTKGDVLNDTKFILIIGLDTENRNLGGAKYFDAITNWHKEKGSELWIEAGDEWLRHQHQLQNRCEIAFFRANESTDFLLGDTENSSEASTLASYIRVLSSIINDDPDPDLTAASWRTKDFVEKIWHSLTHWDSNFERTTLDIAHDYLSFDKLPVSNENLKGLLAKKLEKKTSVYQNTGEPLFSIDLKLPAPNQLALTLNQLVRIKEQIDSGSFDDLSESQKEIFIKYVQSIAWSVKKRWAAPPRNQTIDKL